MKSLLPRDNSLGLPGPSSKNVAIFVGFSNPGVQESSTKQPKVSNIHPGSITNSRSIIVLPQEDVVSTGLQSRNPKPQTLNHRLNPKWHRGGCSCCCPRGGCCCCRRRGGCCCCRRRGGCGCHDLGFKAWDLGSRVQGFRNQCSKSMRVRFPHLF